MNRKLRTPMIVALIAVTAAALLSACADLERISEPGSPYTLPPGGAVSSIYSDSYDSRYEASAISAANHRADKARQKSAAAASHK